MRSIQLMFPLVLMLFASLTCAQQALPVKQVAAPPSDIESGMLTLPDPIDLGVTSRSALFEISPELADENRLIDFAFPYVIGDGQARVVFLPSKPGAWVGIVTALQFNEQQTIELRTDEPIERHGASLMRHPLPWGDQGRVFDAITLPGGMDGMGIRVQLKEDVGGFVLFDQATDRALYTYVKQRGTLVDRPVTLASSLSDGSKIVTLQAIVRRPDGTREVFEADVDEQQITFTPSMPGAYAVQVIAEYANKDNWPVLLTTQHTIMVERPATALGRASAGLVDDRIEFSFADEDSGRRVILAAEVWGQTGEGMIPVCWLSRVCGNERSLSLDPRWISIAGVDPSTLELRQVRVHDVDSFVPLEVIERVALDVPMIELPESPTAITPDMLVGRAPASVGAPSGFGMNEQRGTLPGGHRLLLVHGYCSGGNPFTTSHFSGDIAQFSDPNVSRSHDAFALEIMDQTAPMKSFGVAAHSQGAMAALHLYTFYFSGLDWARGDRLIQSVGAPYQGTALAGNAAVLGDIFGFGCGENSDMSYTGSANWLSTIPTSSRQMVWYYTTSFEDRPFAFDFCNIITDLLLSDPDDGVIERDRGQLPGATNMGHVEGWCHTTGMRDPAQCTDASRNATINARARR